MVPSKLPLLVLLLAVLATMAAHVPTATVAAATAGHYCRDTLGGLLTCHDFMFGGAPVASPECCAAYGAAFDANPFCLCYIANGVYGRSTGYDVNVTRALEIPTSCGQFAPPIELCGMQGLELPPYEPTAPAGSPSPHPAQAPEASSPVAPPPPLGSVAPPPLPRFISPSPPPLPTSDGSRDSSVQMALVFFSTIAACVAVAVP